MTSVFRRAQTSHVITQCESEVLAHMALVQIAEALHLERGRVDVDKAV